MFCFPRNLAAHNSHLKTLFSSLLFEFIIIRSKLTYLEITRRIFNGSIFFPICFFLSTNIPFYSKTFRVVHIVRLSSVAVHFNITRLTSFRIELLVFDIFIETEFYENWIELPIQHGLNENSFLCCMSLFSPFLWKWYFLYIWWKKNRENVVHQSFYEFHGNSIRFQIGIQ